MVDKTFGERIENVDYYERKGAYLITIKNNKLAVVRNNKGYFLLGGKIENSENHAECIKRECIEEIGHKVTIKDYIGCAESYSIHEYFGYFNPVQYYYSGTIEDKVCEPIEEDHVFEWIDLEDIDNKMYLSFQVWAVKKCLNYIL